MHWSERIAEKVIERNPNKKVYVCAAGTSPSGSVHIGNFRDIAVPYFVALALRKKGKQVRFLLSWDDFDRLRKVPVNVSKIHLKMVQQIMLNILKKNMRLHLKILVLKLNIFINQKNICLEGMQRKLFILLKKEEKFMTF